MAEVRDNVIGPEAPNRNVFTWIYFISETLTMRTEIEANGRWRQLPLRIEICYLTAFVCTIFRSKAKTYNIQWYAVNEGRRGVSKAGKEMWENEPIDIIFALALFWGRVDTPDCKHDLWKNFGPKWLHVTRKFATLFILKEALSLKRRGPMAHHTLVSHRIFPMMRHK